MKRLSALMALLFLSGLVLGDHSIMELGDSQRMELDLTSHPMQKLPPSQKDGSVGKGTCHQAQ